MAHAVTGSLCTYELSREVLEIIHEGISSWQLVNEEDGETSFFMFLIRLKVSIDANIWMLGISMIMHLWED
jgi:hypothetical protein